MSSSTSHLIKIAQTQRRRVNKINHDRQRLCELKTSLNSALQTDQLSYADSRSSSHFFKFFKSLKKNHELPAVMKWGQKSVSSTPEACESFNKCFQSVFATPSDLTNFYGCENFLLDDNDISLEKISNFMQCLDVSKSKGHDCLPPVLFKRMDTLKTSIYGLFRTIKRTCTFPSFWKIGKVKPLFKKKVIGLLSPTTQQSHFCAFYRRFLENVFSTACTVLLPRYYTHHSLASQKESRQLFNYSVI